MAETKIPFLARHSKGVTIRVQVQPRSSRLRLVGTHGDALKIQLTAPAVEDRANRQLVDYVAKLLSISKSQVDIVSGKSGRKKTLLITSISMSEIGSRLAKNMA